jgi:hypothetical protein
MKDDSGHFGGAHPEHIELDEAPAQPRTANETAEWYRQYRAKLVAPELTAWQSIPKPVRFAVWVWAITVIIGVAGILIGVALWVITAGALLSQM